MSNDREYKKERRQAIREDKKYQRSLKREERAKKNAQKQAQSSQNKRLFDIITSICGLLLAITVVFALTDGERQISLFGLLEFLSNAPQFDLRDIQFAPSLSITANWGFFNLQRDFLNLIVVGLQGIVNIGVVLLNTISYAWTFLTWVFIG